MADCVLLSKFNTEMSVVIDLSPSVLKVAILESTVLNIKCQKRPCFESQLLFQVSIGSMPGNWGIH